MSPRILDLLSRCWSLRRLRHQWKSFKPQFIHAYADSQKEPDLLIRADNLRLPKSGWSESWDYIVSPRYSLCDSEVDTARVAKSKAIRKEQLKNKTQALLQECCNGSNDSGRRCNIKDDIHEPGRIVASMNLNHVAQWGTREYCAKNKWRM